MGAGRGMYNGVCVTSYAVHITGLLLSQVRGLVGRCLHSSCG